MILASERFGASPERLAEVHEFEKSGHFSPAEKAALRYAQAAAKVPCAVTPEHAAAMQQYWCEADIVEITGVIALFGYLNRWNDTMGTILEDKPIAAGEKYLKSTTDWEIGKHMASFSKI